MNQTTLYAIVQREQLGVHGVVISLERACKELGIRYELLIAEDIALDSIAAMQLQPGSLLYRVSTKAKACIIESMLVLLHRDTFTTIYAPRTMPLASRTYRELCEQIASGLRVIPTHIIDETWAALPTEQLQAKVSDIGGFPVVVKVLGLSHGQGVQKVESAQDLQALLGRVSFTQYGMIARQYLADYRHYRLVIVDGAVVAAIEYHKPEDDFRTNASEEPIVTAVDVASLPQDMLQLGIDGVALRSSILGGVDVLVDQTDQGAYLAEVNVPCYYARAEKPTGIDISSQLIKALIRKRDER
jgi:hypothetical protein